MRPLHSRAASHPSCYACHRPRIGCQMSRAQLTHGNLIRSCRMWRLHARFRLALDPWREGPAISEPRDRWTRTDEAHWLGRAGLPVRFTWPYDRALQVGKTVRLLTAESLDRMEGGLIEMGPAEAGEAP